MNAYVENPMVTGRGYPAEILPVTDCDKCRMEMYRGEVVFEWGADWLCSECFREIVLGLTPAEKAELTGESVVHTEQMWEDACTVREYAELLYVEHKEVE